MVNADQTVHQLLKGGIFIGWGGGYGGADVSDAIFKIRIFYSESPVPICSYNYSRCPLKPLRRTLHEATLTP